MYNNNRTMQNTRTLLIFIITVFYWSITFCQMTVKEKNYTMIYNERNIELQFDSEVHVKAFDAITNKEIYLIEEQEKLNTFQLINTTPAQIIRLEYNSVNNRTTTIQTSYIATQSMSTGAINVYFNHPVTTSFAQTQAAIDLGNTLDDMLISYINACTSTLDIAIYNSFSASSTTGIAGAINAAYNRGVQVRVIYDGSTSSVMIPLLNLGIPILASPDSSFYGIMHNKFVLFDATNSDPNKPFVLTGSTNWTTSQIDGPDDNNIIVIQDQSLAQGYKIEFDEMWGSATMTPDLVNSKFGPYKTDNTPHNYIIGGKTIESYFSPTDGTTSKIINAINSANSDIDIATMLITRSDISAAIINKFNSGIVKTNIVVDSQNPSGNQFSLLQAGLPANQAVIYTALGIMHHKFMVIDNFNSTSDPLVLVGSHNWSNSAETRNDENTLIVHDANIANQYYQAFAYLYQLSGGLLDVNENVISNENLIIYPNPTNGLINITTKESVYLDDVTVSIYDIYGKRIAENHFDNLVNETIDLSNQSAGMYFIAVLDNNETSHFKIIRE